MQKAEKRLNLILRKLNNSNLNNDNINNLDIVNNMCKGNIKFNNKYFYLFNLFVIIIVLCGFITLSPYVYTDECLLESPVDNSKIFREPVNCDMCLNVNNVDKVKNVTKENFHLLYASKMKPVVIIDGTRDWSPINTFNFDFFKKLYENNNHDNENDKDECQFFPYKTEFKSLRDALNMSIARSKLEPGTNNWYIGWSNCNDNAGKILRNYYKKPYFLTDTSENIALSWIFMGGPGFGAHMHVDNVKYPSWQAQLSGRKKWRLLPPPECYLQCNEIEAIVNPGEIIVVDTNRWYHATFIMPDEISITIGSEFD